MAIATTVARNAYNSGYQGTVNLRVASPTGISAGTVLTVAGDLGLTVVHELPNNAFKCEVTQTPPGNGRLIIRSGDTVTG
jgi:hypothetical protein